MIDRIDTLETLARFALAMLLAAVVWPGLAKAQNGTAPDSDIQTRPGSAIVDMGGAIFPPVWCGPAVVAFQREEPGSGRRWIEYHDVERRRVTTEPLSEEGGLVACAADGGERLMARGGTDAPVGQFALVRTSDRSEVVVANDGSLVSADRDLRRFVFRTGDRQSRAPFRLVHLDGTEASDRRVRASNPLDGVPPQFWWPAAIDDRGRHVAYVVGPSVPLDLMPSFASLKLTVSGTGGQRISSSHLTALMPRAAQFGRVSFDRGEVILQGASDDGKLVVAVCSIRTELDLRCRSTTLDLDAGKFHVAGRGSGGFIVGADLGQVRGNGLRACLFLTTMDASGAPPRCAIDPAVQVPIVYGQSPDAYFAVSPGGEYAAVLSWYRQSPSEPLRSRPNWVVVRVSDL